MPSTHTHAVMWAYVPSFTSRTEQVNTIIELIKNVPGDQHFYYSIMVWNLSASGWSWLIVSGETELMCCVLSCHSTVLAKTTP